MVYCLVINLYVLFAVATRLVHYETPDPVLSSPYLMFLRQTNVPSLLSPEEEVAEQVPPLCRQCGHNMGRTAEQYHQPFNRQWIKVLLNEILECRRPYWGRARICNIASTSSIDLRGNLAKKTFPSSQHRLTGPLKTSIHPPLNRFDPACEIPPKELPNSPTYRFP
jgi:hypothetical protein